MSAEGSGYSLFPVFPQGFRNHSVPPPSALPGSMWPSQLGRASLAVFAQGNHCIHTMCVVCFCLVFILVVQGCRELALGETQNQNTHSL